LRTSGNQPELSKINFDPETVEQAAAIPGVAGIKDSSGDTEYLKQVLDRMRVTLTLKSWSVLSICWRRHCAMVHMGACLEEATSFLNCRFDLYEAFRNGDNSLAREIQKRMVEIGRPIWESSEAGPGYLRRLKCALNLLGLCSATPAWPCVESDESERRRIEQHLREHGLVPR
jgi:dihydrodipicolinate synthase/N-acetylneuraminate lyase